jgi:transcription antitermination factor NusG
VRKLSGQKVCWYALRVTYSRELFLKAYLDQHEVESFIPMRHEYIVSNGQRIRKLVPAVHNLVFVHATRKRIDEIKTEYTASLPLRYVMDRETKQPIVIPENQMQHFIAVTGNYDQQLIYLPSVEFSMQKGDHVRITSGIFEGVEGVFVRVKGDRRVVVVIQGVMAVATTFIHPSLIERIPASGVK